MFVVKGRAMETSDYTVQILCIFTLFSFGAPHRHTRVSFMSLAVYMQEQFLKSCFMIAMNTMKTTFELLTVILDSGKVQVTQLPSFAI